MQTLDTATMGVFDNPAGAAAAIDPSAIVTTLPSVKEARALPRGSIVGDLQGGLTFTDAVAAALEARSIGGWQEHIASGETWTIIVVDR